MKARLLSFLVASSVLGLLVAGVLLPAPWIAKESIFEFTARAAKAKGFGKPADSANTGGALRTES